MIVVFSRVRWMRIFFGSTIRNPEIGAMSMRMKMRMRVRVRLDDDDTRVGVRVLLDRQMQRQQKGLEQKAQADGNSEHCPHRSVPWSVLHHGTQCGGSIDRARTIVEANLGDKEHGQETLVEVPHNPRAEPRRVTAPQSRCSPLTIG